MFFLGLLGLLFPSSVVSIGLKPPDQWRICEWSLDEARKNQQHADWCFWNCNKNPSNCAACCCGAPGSHTIPAHCGNTHPIKPAVNCPIWKECTWDDPWDNSENSWRYVLF